MYPEYTYAANIKHFTLFNAAYACSPIHTYSIAPYVDSIKVTSTPDYNSQQLENQLLFIKSTSDEFSLSEFNSNFNRNMDTENSQIIEFVVSNRPTKSDSFTFSFYYYKGGALIDSSATQKFYISN